MDALWLLAGIVTGATFGFGFGVGAGLGWGTALTMRRYEQEREAVDKCQWCGKRHLTSTGEDE